MRLPWPFSRTQRSTSDGAAGHPGGEPVERAPAGAWRDLPPLAETVGPPPLVAPNRPFAEGLAAGEAPAPILAPLSHGRSLEAPRGLVVGVAKPTSASAAAALPPPVQRSPLGRRSHVQTEAAWVGPTDPAEPAPEPGWDRAASSPTPTELPVLAVRALPTTDAAPSTANLTRAPQPSMARPSGLIGQPRARRTAPPPTAEPAVAASVQRAPAESPSRPAPPSGAPAPLSATPRLTIGQARRLGLGAPIPGATGLGTPVGRPAIQRAPLDPGAGRLTPQPAGSATPPAPLTAEPDVPSDLPLAARPTGQAREASASHERAPEAASAELAQPTAPMASPASGRAPLADAGPSAPIVSRQPLRTSVQRAPLALPAVKREPDPSATEAPFSAGPAAVSPGPVRIHRGAEASELSDALDARSFTHGGEIYMPDAHGPLTSGKGRALLAHELTHVTQQRRLGSSLPQEHTPQGKVLEAEAVAAERSSSLPLAAGTGDGPPSASSSMAVGLASSPSLPDDPANGIPTPQRSPRAAQATAAHGGGSEGGRGGAHQPSEQELEILAHQLYHRIGRHLRRELLVDRERLGVALDRP